MADYRRTHIPWGAYFLTIATHERYPLFHDARARVFLREAVEKTQTDWPMTIHEMVLLPDHIHLLCGIDSEDQDYSTRIRIIKKRFTHAWLANGGAEGASTSSRRRRGIRGVWQKRFYEHTIRNQREFRDHVVYIHMNPVKHGLAKRPIDWPWSTFHRHVAKGDLPADWEGATGLRGIGEYDNEIW